MLPLTPPTWLVAQYTVYLYQRLNKSEPCFCLNRGYETGVFLRFLVDHYERLPAVMAFVQADWLQAARGSPGHWPAAFDFWQPRCAFDSADRPFRRWMPLGKRHSCWPPGQISRTSSYWPNKRSHLPGVLIEACWHELLFLFGHPRLDPLHRLNVTFYPFQNFVASRERIREHAHSSYLLGYARLVVNGTCLDPPMQPGPHGGVLKDSPAYNKETVAKGMEHLMHAIFGDQPVTGSGPAQIPADASCELLASPHGAACQHGL